MRKGSTFAVGCLFTIDPASDPQIPLIPCADAPSPMGVVDAAVPDLDSVVDAVYDVLGASTPLAVVGFSRGAGIAALRASEGRLEPVVLVSGKYEGWSTLGDVPGGDVNVVERVNGWRPPALVLHGTADAAIPVAQAHDFEAALLATGASVEAHYYEGAGHNLAGEPAVHADLEDRITRFLSRGSPVPGDTRRVPSSSPAPPKLPSSFDELARRDPRRRGRMDRRARCRCRSPWRGRGTRAHHGMRAARRAELTGAELDRCELTDVRLVGCELSGAILTESSWLRVELQNCRMAGLIVSQSRLRDVRFTDDKLDGADFRMSRAERVVFEGCAMPDADLYEALLTSVAFDACDLRRAHFSAVKVDGLRLHRSNLEGIRGGASLRGATVSPEQVLPLALGVFAELGIRIEPDPPPV